MLYLCRAKGEKAGSPTKAIEPPAKIKTMNKDQEAKDNIIKAQIRAQQMADNLKEASAYMRHGHLTSVEVSVKFAKEALIEAAKLIEQISKDLQNIFLYTNNNEAE